MCGKFEIFEIDDLQQIIAAIECSAPLHVVPDWPARFPHVVPGDEISIIVREENGLGLRKLVWGYDAPWDERRGLAFNTRIERAFDQTMWTTGFESGRALVASPAFYETDASGKPHRFTDERERTPLLMAAISEGGRFSLVTREADEVVRRHHPRMPLSLDSASALQWLEVGPEAIQRAAAVPLRHHASAPLPGQFSLF